MLDAPRFIRPCNMQCASTQWLGHTIGATADMPSAQGRGRSRPTACAQGPIRPTCYGHVRVTGDRASEAPNRDGETHAAVRVRPGVIGDPTGACAATTGMPRWWWCCA